MVTSESGGFGAALARRTARGGRGSLAQIVRVETRLVIKLALLFSLWMLLPLILLEMSLHHIEAVHILNVSQIDLETLWGVLLFLLALALSLALAFSIARQQSLAKALGQAVDNLPMQFAYIDAARCYRFNNRASLDNASNLGEGHYGRPVREVLGESTYRQIEPYLDRALSGQRVDFELHLADGDRASDLAVAYLPDVADSGQVKGLFVLADDITRRKQAERRDKEQLLEFAHLSRLASVGEVAAEIAHQINQPLAAIAMFSSAAERTLAGGGDPEQVRAWLATINAQSKRASEVIGSLRRFVRPGKMDPVVLDVNTPLREVAALLAHDAAARQVGLNLEFGESLPPILATGILIEQVVFNLARNAILAAAGLPHPAQVTIRSHADAKRVWVDVFSAGSGQVEAPDSAEDEADAAALEEGLGFSLAISRSIIAGFNGEVGCRSRAGGATFCYFHLPRYQT